MDEHEFHRLALSELEAVYRLAYHLAPSAHEVDDLVQETYLHALKGACTFQMQQHGIRPWLFKILHNVVNARLGKQRRDEKVIDALRRQAAEPDESSDPLPSEPVAPSFDGVAWDGVDERLKQAIELLPFNNKVVFLLSAVEQLRYREIAELIGVPIGTVMSRLHRARAVLAAHLRELADERGLPPPPSSPPPRVTDERSTDEIKRGP